MYDFINIFVTKNTEHIGINSQMIYLNIYIYHLNYIELILRMISYRHHQKTHVF